MAQAKSSRIGLNQKATAGERKAKAAEEARLQAEALRTERSQQLTEVRNAITQFSETRNAIQLSFARRDALESHLVGLYDELDKLTKKLSQLEVTDLVLNQVNDSIRDAKDIVGSDAYLDRIKEFVPAGNNPSYQDVLIITRTVQQCLGRYKLVLLNDKSKNARLLQNAETIFGALSLSLQSEEEDASSISKEDVKKYTGKDVTEEWFTTHYREDESYFKFDVFDRLELQEYFGVEVAGGKATA